MRRTNILYFFCLFITFAIFGVSGCKKPGTDKDQGKEKKQHTGEEEKQPDPVAIVPSPNPIPKLELTKKAEIFPKIVKVPPPPEHKDKLVKMQELIKSKQWNERSKGIKLLKDITKTAQKNMHLMRYLITSESPLVVTRSLRLLGKLKDHEDFLPVVVSLLGHPSDEVRGEAVSLLTYGLKVENVGKAIPYVRALLDDKSCNVRRRALAVILGNNRRLKFDAREIVRNKMEDPCPAVTALATRNLGNILLEEEINEKLVEKLLKKAAESPYYLNRCAAMTALGGLVKSKEKYDEKGKLVTVPKKEEEKKSKTFSKSLTQKVTKTLAEALTIPVMPSMTVQYEDGKTPYTFSNHSSLPACAADALASHYGESPKSKPVERVKLWRERMAAKGWSKKPPENLCTGRRECKKDGEICYKMECTPMDKIVPIYWEYVQKDHCRKKPKEKPKWRNFGDELVIELGLGLHWMFRHDVRKYLISKDKEAFSKKFAAVRSMSCD